MISAINTRWSRIRSLFIELQTETDKLEAQIDDLEPRNTEAEATVNSLKAKIRGLGLQHRSIEEELAEEEIIEEG